MTERKNKHSAEDIRSPHGFEGFIILFQIYPAYSVPVRPTYQVCTQIGLFIFIFPGGHQIALCCVIHNFIFQQGSGSKATAWAPFNIWQQIPVASCKTVYLETFCWWPPMFNWGPGPAAGDEFSKPLSLAKSTWAQHSWTALATQISHFSRSLCLFFFTLIPVWLSHATCRSMARGNDNPSWGWGYNLWRSPHYVGGGEWSPPSFTEVFHFQRQYGT